MYTYELQLRYCTPRGTDKPKRYSYIYEGATTNTMYGATYKTHLHLRDFFVTFWPQNFPSCLRISEGGIPYLIRGTLASHM